MPATYYFENKINDKHFETELSKFYDTDLYTKYNDDWFKHYDKT